MKESKEKAVGMENNAAKETMDGPKVDNRYPFDPQYKPFKLESPSVVKVSVEELAGPRGPVKVMGKKGD
jgi:hypothetical protein